MRDYHKRVTIEAVLNGWIVTVGCQKIVFDNASDLAKELQQFLLAPAQVENKYRENAVNGWLLEEQFMGVDLAREGVTSQPVHSRLTEEYLRGGDPGSQPMYLPPLPPDIREAVRRVVNEMMGHPMITFNEEGRG